MNATVFLLAGFESTSLNLGYATYELAKNFSYSKKITRRN